MALKSFRGGGESGDCPSRSGKTQTQDVVRLSTMWFGIVFCVCLLSYVVMEGEDYAPETWPGGMLCEKQGYVTATGFVHPCRVVNSRRPALA